MGQYEGGMVGRKMSVYLHTVAQVPSGLRAVLWEPPGIAHLCTHLIIHNLSQPWAESENNNVFISV